MHAKLSEISFFVCVSDILIVDIQLSSSLQRRAAFSLFLCIISPSLFSPIAVYYFYIESSQVKCVIQIY